MQEILKRLISFKTLSKDQNENIKAINYIRGELEHLPLAFKEYSSNGFGSLVVTTKKSENPALLLQAHLDVVAGSPEVFKPKVMGDKLFGRGAFDMKFAIACYIKILKELGRGLNNYSLGVMITTDEELGGRNGVNYLLNTNKFSPKICVLPDGGQNWEVQQAAKGVIHLRIESHGKSVHGSRTWQGVNAIDNLVSFTDFLRSIFPKEPCGQKDHFHSTINLGQLEGGTVANQVPDFATALVDIRFIPGKDKERILKRIEAGKRRFKDIKVKEISFGDSFEINIKDLAVYEFLKIVKEITGISPKFIISHGSSDARFFTKRNIPVIATRPNGGGHHGENEWVDLKSLDQFYLVLRKYIDKVALSK